MKNTQLIEARAKTRDKKTGEPLSQTKAARLAGISNITLWRYEQGLMEPGPKKLKALARVYGCKVADIAAVAK